MYSTDQHISPKGHKVQVASNTCYDILYDESKNRVYFNIHGYWKNVDCVPDLISDWSKTLSLVKSHFTLLTNMRSMITHPQELSTIHEQVHKLILDAGVIKTAHVMPVDKIAYLQVLAIQEKTNLPAQAFTSEEEASEWLNIIPSPSDN